MSPRRFGSASKVVLAAAIVLGIAAIPIYLMRRPVTTTAPPQPTRTPTFTIQARNGEIRTVPDVEPTFERRGTREVARALRKLYTTAFIRQPDAPTPSPRKKAIARIRPLLVRSAAVALKNDPGVFDLGDDLVVLDGTVRFEGLLTFDRTRPTRAVLDVDFAARAVPMGRLGQEVRVRQVGALRLVQRSGEWLVDGFDLRIVTRPVPTPEPSPR